MASQLTDARRAGRSIMAMLALALLIQQGPIQQARAAIPPPDGFITLVDLHPVDPAVLSPVPTPANQAMPTVVLPGADQGPDPRQVMMPAVATPAQPDTLDPTFGNGKSGTGFFVGENGTLLTAAHVVTGCSRMQVISQYVRRTWVSLVASDEEQDIALLRAADVRPPAVIPVAGSPPSGGKLLILGFPASAGLLTPAETWAVMENQKFPPGAGSLANPRELLWVSAPGVARGYSGGPIFDPRQGAVVGIVKGQVDGGYLRLVRDMPTTGMAIGPGIGLLGTFLRHEMSYLPLSASSVTDEGWESALRRATVHVLCWH